MTPSPKNKAVAKHAHKALGGTLRVQAFHHDVERLSIDMLICVDRPSRGVTSYSTIGVSDVPMLKGKREFPTRLEIAGVCASTETFFPNVIAAAAFCVVRTRKLLFPGAVLPGYVGEYYPSTTVPHLYFTAPFLWESELRTLEVEGIKVSWLLAIPISDAELAYREKAGDDALETRFEECQIDVFDLSRVSVVS